MYVPPRKKHPVDLALSALLIIQCFTLFVAIPLGFQTVTGRLRLDACHLAFAAVCIVVLTRRRLVQVGLLLVSLALIAASHMDRSVLDRFAFSDAFITEGDALIAFVFDVLVTAVVVRHVCVERVTAHQLQGAALIYLNIASLFAIAYGVLDTYVPGALVLADGGSVATGAGTLAAAMTYFSLATITTTGYGDLVPIHPYARSLANLEAVFGQLFLATFLARLVALHLAQTVGQQRTSVLVEEAGSHEPTGRRT